MPVNLEWQLDTVELSAGDYLFARSEALHDELATLAEELRGLPDPEDAIKPLAARVAAAAITAAAIWQETGDLVPLMRKRPAS